MNDRSGHIVKRLRIRKSMLGPLDIIREARRSVTRQLARSVATSLGALLGCAAFVSTLGLSGTATHQISASFDIRRSTEITVTRADDGQPHDADDAELTSQWYTGPAVERVRKIVGVVHAGRVTTIEAVDVRRLFLPNVDSIPVDLYAVDSGSLAAIAPSIVVGREFDPGHEVRADPVVMLSVPVAARLGITQPGAVVFIGDFGFTVAGIYNDVSRLPGVAGGIIVPITVQESNRVPHPQMPGREFLLETAPGASTQVGHQAALAIAPSQPALVDVNSPPDPKTLRQEIEGNAHQLSLLVSVIVLVLGAISIGNSAAVQVVLRTPEIGLRRALGARRSDIFVQLLGESAALGTFGGTLGATTGLVVTFVVSVTNRWVPVLDPAIPGLAIAAGTVAGVLAGAYPAFRATKITPAHALAR